MPEAHRFPYETHLDIHYGPLEVIDLPARIAAVTHPWYNQTLCRVNESVVRLGVIQGEYHWHHHDDQDEFFYVVEGRLLIDLEQRTVARTAAGLRRPQGRAAPHARTRAHRHPDGRGCGHHPDRRRGGVLARTIHEPTVCECDLPAMRWVHSTSATIFAA